MSIHTYLSRRGIPYLPPLPGFTYFLSVTLVGTMGINSCSVEESTDPNIIFIMADDLGYHDLAGYGQNLFPTPATDQLVQEGMRFTNTLTPSAVCSPTRYGVLTGTDPFRQYHTSHVLFNGEPLVVGEQEATIASLLQQNGYRTGVIGKWHLGLGDSLPRDINHPGRGPNNIGFDYSFLVPDGHNMYPRYYIENGKSVGNPDYYYSSEIVILDRVGYKLIQHIPDDEWENRRPDNEISTVIADKADAFIEENKDKKFFLYYPTHSIHRPYTPGPRFFGKSQIGPLIDFIMEFDWKVGRIMDTLDRLGLTDNTIVIVTSDNGGFGSGRVRNYQDEQVDHQPTFPWRGNKGTAYEGGHRVPFIVRWPGHTKPGSESDETISLVDITATLSDITGISLQPSDALDSFSFLPVLLGKDYGDRIRPYTVTGTRGMVHLAIREGPWKLIYAPESREAELYHLDDDPQESKNIADLNPELTEKMIALLTNYIESGHSRPDAKGSGHTFEELFRQREARNQLINQQFE